MYEEEYEDDADFAYRNGEYNNEVDEYGSLTFDNVFMFHLFRF